LVGWGRLKIKLEINKKKLSSLYGSRELIIRLIGAKFSAKKWPIFGYERGIFEKYPLNRIFYKASFCRKFTNFIGYI
jgi:hypothetical protein